MLGYALFNMPGSSEEGKVDNEVIVRILASGEKIRREKRQEALEKLTTHEQDLVREAAVASFARAALYYGVHNPQIPNNAEIVDLMLDTATTFSDLYPTLSDYKLPRTESPRFSCI